MAGSPSSFQASSRVWAPPIAARKEVYFPWVGFALLHIPIGILLRQSEAASTVHALVVGLLGAAIALNHRRPHLVGYVAAYIAGAEVLWRMTGANVFWEYGKYSTAAILLLAILTRRSVPAPGGRMGYFILLLPAAVLTIDAVTPAVAQDQISFYLSGPLAIAICLWYFSDQQIDKHQLQRMFMMLLAPIYAIAAIAADANLTINQLLFTSAASNSAASGGFGPNQVSTILGLGALICFLFLVLLSPNTLLKVFLSGSMFIFIVLVFLTFSRGGLYLFGAGVAAATFFLARDRQKRIYTLVFLILSALILQRIVLPRLDDFTGGTLLVRYTDIGLTGRYQMMRGEILTWRDHPLFGVGPGMAGANRGMQLNGQPVPAASHNEFTRLLGEHGLLGAAAGVLLIRQNWRSFRQAQSPEVQALIAALITWSFLYIFYTAIRTVAPALLLGIGGAALITLKSSLTGAVNGGNATDQLPPTQISEAPR